MQIAGQTFIVTGAASGLGAATAKQLHRAGARVVLADLNEPATRAIVEQLGDGAEFVHADVTSEESVRGALAQAATSPMPVRGVVHCAGILGASRVLSRDGSHDLELFNRVIQVNLVGTFNITRLAAELMAKNEPVADEERGVIINTASVAAFEGQIGQAAYAASKGGVAAMTLPIARELARVGIRVVAIAPGIFATPMMHGAPQSVLDSLLETTVFPKRLGDPGEFAALAQHIIENPMLNGSVIRLDGAIRMPPK